MTTALVAGGLAVSGVANAEVKGSMKFGYAFSEGKSNDATAAGTQGFNKETQIDMSTSGELSNGMSFKAGASFEAEGNKSFRNTSDTGSASIDDIDADEGVFIEIGIADGTRLHFGQDKFNNLDDSVTPTTGTPLTTQTNAGGTSGHFQNPNSPYGDFGVGVAHNTPFGEVSALYVPQAGDAGRQGNNTSTNINGGTAFELKFKGNLGVEGLSVLLGYNEEEVTLLDEDRGTQRDQESTVYGAGYNFGSVAIGFNKVEIDQTDVTTDEAQEIGVTFAVSDDVTVGLGKTKAEASDKTVDVEATIASIGYNLGPIALELSYSDVENHNFSAGDVTGASIQTSVKF